MSKLIIGLIVAFFLFTLSAFTVDQREHAVLLKWGEIQRADYDPGLHFKIPFMNNVKRFDKRILTEDEAPARYLTLDKKYVVVDSFIKWQITDPGLFYKATTGNYNQAGLLIYQKVNDNLLAEFAKRYLHDLISGERRDVMNIVTVRSNKQTKELGVEVVDVRLKRIDFPDDVSEKVYDRMRSERERVAKEIRSQGEAEAERIRAKADRKSTEILAEGYRDAEILRGEGDAKATETYANAYGKDEEFYAFYRRMNAYQSSFSNQDDVMLLEPDSDFFKYFKNPDAH